MTLTYSADGVVNDPSPPSAELAPNTQLQVTLQSIKPENAGLTKTVIDANGERTTVPVESDHMIVTCEYPGEFIKNHQVAPDFSDLPQKILNTIKGKFGVGHVTVITAPTEMIEGATFTVGSN